MHIQYKWLCSYVDEVIISWCSVLIVSTSATVDAAVDAVVDAVDAAVDATVDAAAAAADPADQRFIKQATKN